MARLFLDTSALIKLYRVEPNSIAVQACVRPSDDLLIAPITPLEFHSAFYGLIRQQRLISEEVEPFLTAFAQDQAQYISIEPTERILNRAKTLLDRWAVSEGLRPLDAIQLASALEAHKVQPLDSLITTDAVLALVAHASGLTVLPQLI